MELYDKHVSCMEATTDLARLTNIKLSVNNLMQKGCFQADCPF